MQVLISRHMLGCEIASEAGMVMVMVMVIEDVCTYNEMTLIG